MLVTNRQTCTNYQQTVNAIFTERQSLVIKNASTWTYGLDAFTQQTKKSALNNVKVSIYISSTDTRMHT